MMAVEDAADDVVQGLDHNTFVQAGDVLAPGQSDFGLNVSVKDGNQHQAYGKNAYTMGTTELCQSVTDQVEKVSRSTAAIHPRDKLVNFPGNPTTRLRDCFLTTSKLDYR